MRRVLVLLTSSYPFGEGETFLAGEFPFLTEAFDQVVILSNDTERDLAHPLPESVRILRHGYALSPGEKIRALLGLGGEEVREELRTLRSRYRLPLTRGALSTILVSWEKAKKFSRVIREVAKEYPEARIHAYSYWANDMALAAAVARERGWVHRAICRAHGWDLYFHRADAGFLPFRLFLASNLDRMLAVSEDGREYLSRLLGPGAHPAVGLSRLGTPPLAARPVASRDPFTLLTCSRMIPLKRVDRIARALLHVRTPTRWIHVGDGPERAAVEGICRTFPSHVIPELVGHLPHEEVLALYARRRPSLFLNLSESEGIPVTMMEAMSAGVPVVGTSVGGVGEIVAHGENGWLLPADPTPLEAAEAIDALAGLPEEEYRSRSETAWKTWHERYNADKNYGAFLEEFEYRENTRRA